MFRLMLDYRDGGIYGGGFKRQAEEMILSIWSIKPNTVHVDTPINF